MPEQAEWQPNIDNADDYRWHPTYARRAMDSLNPAYDTRTLTQKLDDALKRIEHLEAIVHKYINRSEGEP